MPAHANETVPYFDDIPKISGFSYIDDSLIIFDKPEGQIIEASLICEKNCPELKAIDEYYHRVLSNLGWVKNSPKTYMKSGQRLTLDTKHEGQSVILIFQQEN